MFTGIVEGIRKVASVRRGDEGIRFAIDFGPLAAEIGLGDSIAINGCCLTVDELDGSLSLNRRSRSPPGK